MRSRYQILDLLKRLPKCLAWMRNSVELYKEAKQAFLRIEEKYRLFLNYCNDAIFVYHITDDGVPGTFIEVNQTACRQLGYLREELLEMSLNDLAAPAAQPGTITFLGELFRRKSLVTESFHRAKDGSQIPVELSCRLFTLDGRPTVLTVARDLTERRKAEEDLRESQQHFKALFETVFDGIFIYDDKGTLLEVNESLAKMFGYRRSELVGTSVMRFIPPQDKDVVWEEDVRGRIRRPFETQGVRKDGSLFDLELFGQRIQYMGRSVRVTVGRDTTERKKAEEAIRYRATHDCLTGLPNRSLFFDRLRQALAQAERTGSLVAVHFFDLDQFKETNDRLGHSIGDALLEAVAERLQSCCRRSDTVARLGGDEFAVIQTNFKEARAAAKPARLILKALAEPFPLNGQSIRVTASIGIALYPRDGSEPDDLVRRADHAMYEMKRVGGSGFAFYKGAPETRRETGKDRRPA